MNIALYDRDGMITAIPYPESKGIDEIRREKVGVVSQSPFFQPEQAIWKWRKPLWLFVEVIQALPLPAHFSMFLWGYLQKRHVRLVTLN